MQHDLDGRTIAILATDGFEQVELLEPRKALDEAGAVTHVVAPKDQGERIRGWDHDHWGDEVAVEVPLAEADPAAYDALLLPGGVMNPDNLRADEEAVEFTRSFFTEGKPVAAICHGPWTLIEAGVVEGRRMTSYHSIRTDLVNAGAEWVDEEVVVDRGLVSSRNPDDIPAFNDAMLAEFARGRNASQQKHVEARATTD